MALLLFDGECGLCNRAVQFVYRRDRRARVRFAALDSATGRRLLAEHGIVADASTMVLVDDEGAHMRSTAALRVARLLRWPWPLAYAFVIVPRRVRDAVYDAIARRRHRLGLTCPPAPPELRARMDD